VARQPEAEPILTRNPSFVRRLRATTAAIFAGAVLVGVAGCSATSLDEAKNTAPTDATGAPIEQPATGNESFPNLGSVPDQAPAVPSEAERQNVIEGLSSDRSHAQYTDQQFSNQPSAPSLAPPEPAPPPETISTEPPPQAAPTAPVESAPIDSNEGAEAPAAEPAGEPSAEAAPETVPDATESAAAAPAESDTQIAPPAYEQPAEIDAPETAADAPEAAPTPAPAAMETAAAPAETAAPAAAETSAPAPAALTQATSTMTPPPPSAPPPSSTGTTSSSYAMPGQPGTVVPPVPSRPDVPLTSSSAPASASVGSPSAPAASASITSTPLEPPATMPAATMPATTSVAAAQPMPAATQTAAVPSFMPPSMSQMPPTTVIGGDGAGGTAYYQTYDPSAQSSTVSPASYASNAVTVDMSAVDRGGGAPTFYPNAMANAYTPPALPSMIPPRTSFAPGAAGGPAGMIYFGEGGAKLDASDRDVLKSVAAIYRQRGGVIRVVGHSSRDGAATYAAQQANLQLSWARANAVARELARDGVDPGAIQADGLGDSQPVYLESTAAGRAANRRVEIYFY